MSDAVVAEMAKTEEQAQVPTQGTVLGALPEQTFTGRGVFTVQTVDVGIAVSGAILTDDGRLLNAPAVFPDLGYALSQIDELRALVLKHFGEAAAIGVQVLAQASRASAQSVSESTQASAIPASPEEVSQPAADTDAEDKVGETKLSAKTKK